MARKQWSAKEEITPELLQAREKRKWQIALRRYVMLQSPSPEYAPYFGLDSANIRKWFALQFEEGVNWEGFGKSWQFDQIIPVQHFDFAREEDMRLCWNFVNLRVEHLSGEGNKGGRLDLLVAKNYFRELQKATGYAVCGDLLAKIDEIEANEAIKSVKQVAFIQENLDFLRTIKTFGVFEFELLNSGKSATEVQKEAGFIKNIGN